MKRVLFFVLLTSVVGFFYSCSSEAPGLPSTEPNEELFDVVFNVDGFTVGTTPLKNAGGKYVSYRVYVENGSEVMIEKKLTPSDFSGKISLKLPKGNFRIVVFLSNTFISDFINTQSVTGGNNIQYDNSGILYQNITQDIFRGEANFTVGTQNMAQSLTVKRPISRINLAIEDLAQIPSSVKTIVPVIYHMNGDWVRLVQPLHIFLSGRTQYFLGLDLDFDFSIPYQKIAISRNNISSYGKDNPISFYFPQNQTYRFLNGGEFVEQDLYLVGIDDANVTAEALVFENPKIVYSRLLKKNIQLLPNQSITITGTIFENNGIHVEIDEDWGETIDNEF